MGPFLPGDVALVSQDTFIGWAIRLGTRSPVNHARLVVSEDGKVLEALARGARWGTVEPGDIVLRPPMTDEQRAVIPGIARHLYGTPYGFLDVAALGLAQFGITLPSVKRRIKDPDHLFCSQLVDYGWMLATFHAFTDRRTPQDVTPGNILMRAFRPGWQVIQHSIPGSPTSRSLLHKA